SEVLDIIDKYYPGVKTAWNPDYPSIRIDDGINVVAEPSRRGYAIYDERDLSEKTEIANALMHDLAANGLITEFYGWGQTASYSKPIATPAILYYPNCYESNDELYLTDLDKVKNYLKENHAECEVVMEESDSSKEPDLKKPAYHITVPETMTARDEFMLAIELYQNLGISARFFEFNSASGSLVGHNAMERPGDTNLDCEVDILDVIAANKHILGVGTLDKTGLKNADMDGNGTADSADSLAILKAALDIDG
ncbi:MAG: dockerin type I repeat-containing protein, partial [Oscillospiraceae bacterium]|nr:dockerin type I repeat-containing protein [Oscillospiraceae bacterium]